MIDNATLGAFLVAIPIIDTIFNKDDVEILEQAIDFTLVGAGLYLMASDKWSWEETKKAYQDDFSELFNTLEEITWPVETMLPK